MEVKKTILDGCHILEPIVFKDSRGLFLESFNEKRFNDALKTSYCFVQDNWSVSKKGTLRGLHYQERNPQGKLVWVVSGEVYDVAVDLRKKSRTFGKYFGLSLSGSNKKQLWIPPGFAHGFQVVSAEANFCYKCTDFYDKSDQKVLRWDDPDLNIDWPIKDAILSDRDKNGHKLNDLND